MKADIRSSVRLHLKWKAIFLSEQSNARVRNLHKLISLRRHQDCSIPHKNFDLTGIYNGF